MTSNPITVLDYFVQARPDKVAEVYCKEFGKDDWATPETFCKVRERLMEGPSVQSELKARIYNGVDFLSQSYVGVDGVASDGEKFSIELTAWNELRTMEVIVETEKISSLEEATAFIYYEMTFFGWPEKAEEFKAQLIDTIEGIERGLIKTTPFDPDKYLKSS